MHPRTLLLTLLVFTMAFAGCVVDPGEDDDETGSSPDTQGRFSLDGYHKERTKTSGGIVLAGTMRHCDESLCVDVNATNEDGRSYHISNICVPPWEEQMTRHNDTVAHREPTFHCLAFGLREFEDGETIQYSTQWDARVWNDAASGYEDAPSGTYAWRITLMTYDESDGAGRERHQIPFFFRLIDGMGT